MKGIEGMQLEQWHADRVRAATHYKNCESMQVALADVLRVDLLLPEPPTPPERRHRFMITTPAGRPFRLTGRGPFRRTY